MMIIVIIVIIIDQKMSDQMLAKAKSKQTKYLSEYFSPLEARTEVYTDFLSLRLGALLCILESGEVFADSENSLLLFVVEWLRHDTQRQTSDNIQLLLQTIRVKYLNGAFLHDMVTFNNFILNKWEGFREWIFDAVGYLVRPIDQKKGIVKVHNKVCRNADPHAWFDVPHQKGELPCAVRWMVRLSPVEENKRFEPVPHFLLRDGVKYSPTCLSVAPSHEEGLFDLTLHMTSTTPLVGTQFVLGLVPADRAYDRSKMLFDSNFARYFLKWTEEFVGEGEAVEYTLWHTDQDFLDLINEHGVYVCVLPVTKQEYTRLTGMSFAGYYKINRGYTTTHKSPQKIKLGHSSNFSV